MIDNNDTAKYCTCMEEVKLRTSAITSILNKECTTKYRMTNVEFVCGQFRKVLELIALASLAANKNEYAKQHSKFSQHWNAKRIIEDLEKLNPRFYPVPGEQVLDGTTCRVVEVKNIEHGYLTKEEFVNIYDICSTFLHTRNPYGLAVDIEQAESEFDGWLAKTIRLLNHHQIQLLDKDYQLWVLMNSKDDGRVHAFTMQRFDLNT